MLSRLLSSENILTNFFPLIYSQNVNFFMDLEVLSIKVVLYCYRKILEYFCSNIIEINRKLQINHPLFYIFFYCLMNFQNFSIMYYFVTKNVALRYFQNCWQKFYNLAPIKRHHLDRYILPVYFQKLLFLIKQTDFQKIKNAISFCYFNEVMLQTHNLK